MTNARSQPGMLVRDVIARRLPLPPGEIPGHTPLGAEGLGLDSIAIFEVLLECQERFGANALDLLDGKPVTVARLVDHVERATNP